MAEFFQELFSNRVLIAGIAGWFVAQTLKMILYSVINRTLNWERMIGDGGMPSAHSATVSSMAMSSALIYGVGSFEFAVTTMLATIVMHDAMGVRWETGKQAKILNEMLALFEELGKPQVSAEKKLKEFVGHTPLQVLCGMLLGILVALGLYFWVY
ncbi:MAG: divergent PAP2 family protein [Lachnospiraceae bacterium]|nr:divergent PAP2 family protein [Lachnospiraceae bacterium]